MLPTNATTARGFRSSHAQFLHDIEIWGNITNTLWIWDYTTDFENFIAPWPDYFSLGPNMCAAAPSAAAAAAAATDNRLKSAASFN
jgi:hypothetical protein